MEGSVTEACGSPPQGLAGTRPGEAQGAVAPAHSRTDRVTSLQVQFCEVLDQDGEPSDSLTLQASWEWGCG